MCFIPDSVCVCSTLVSKMEHLTDLQRHLEACFHDTGSNAGQESKPASGNTSYTAYYFMRGEEGGEEGEGVDGGRTPPKRSSTPKKRSPRTPPKAEHLVREEEGEPQQAQLVRALQSELEEVKRWNEALQTRLRESGGRRDVGVGMEKGGTPPIMTSLAQEKYQELEAEVDRLLGELEEEREQSQAEREQQETESAALRGELSAARERVAELEQALREAVVRDAGTSTAEAETIAGLEEEVEELRGELEKAREAVARLDGQLLEEKEDNQRLREELGRKRGSPGVGRVDRGTSVGSIAATASAPNLLTPDRTPGKKTTSDSWTSPGVSVGGGGGEGVDVRELKERHREVTRLNQELQRKCREQLHRSPPSASGHSNTWQVHVHPEDFWNFFHFRFFFGFCEMLFMLR